WGIRKLYSWGGWSLEFNSLTIVRYLLSRNDDLIKSREDYMNPRAQKGTLYPYCGRSYNCA
ncbi:uncharacterized protein K441DRAFT_577279, partial [Cenococcum geophilum 1.58]|uniref:uncharacterized protein n=1 Tax=Cenococcum geophilum 1.58 TaxID=794803 RepID=UPI00358F2B92